MADTYVPTRSHNVDAVRQSLYDLDRIDRLEVSDGATPGTLWLETFQHDRFVPDQCIFLTRKAVTDLYTVLGDAMEKSNRSAKLAGMGAGA